MREQTKKQIRTYEIQLELLSAWIFSERPWRMRRRVEGVGWAGIVLGLPLALAGAFDVLDHLGWSQHLPFTRVWHLLMAALGVALMFAAGRVEQKLKRGAVPRAAARLHFPLCYRCDHDLSALLTDAAAVRVVCPSCGHRQKRSRAPEGFDPQSVLTALSDAERMAKLRDEVQRRTGSVVIPAPSRVSRVATLGHRPRPPRVGVFLLWRVLPRRSHFRWGSGGGLGAAGESWLSTYARTVVTACALPASVLFIVNVIDLAADGRIVTGPGFVVVQGLFTALFVVPVMVAHWSYSRTLLRNTPKVYCSFALPTCYRCGFDLAGLLDDNPRARVVCPECGQRQLRCRLPNLRRVVPPVDVHRPVTPAQPLAPKSSRSAAPPPRPPGVTVRVIRDEPVEAGPRRS
jgi:transcription elongation factor Elf1